MGMFVTDKPTADRRIFELDAFRGIAAVAVVIFHYTSRFDELYGYPSPVPHFDRGAYGPHVFFVISGFVILMTLERTKKSMDFVTSRFFRLYPVYWAGLILTFTVLTLFPLPHIPEIPFRRFLVNLTMLQGFFRVKHVDGVYWTLTVELAFYIVMFAIHRLGWMKRLPVLLYLWLGVDWTYHALLEGFAINHWTMEPFRVFMITDFAHYFLMGVAFRVAQVTPKARRWAYPLVALCIASVFVLDGTDIGFIILGTAVLFHLIIEDKVRWLAWKPLVFLGAISYPLYIVHQNVGFVLLRSLADIAPNPWLRMGIVTTIVVLVSTAMTWLIERPSLRMRKKFRAATAARRLEARR